MALAPSFYSTGTATVAANGTAVTGQGTSWLNAVQPGDLFGTHKGIPIRIASVNSNTSLTLAFPWPGAAQNAAAYEIQLLPDAGRVLETTRQLLEMLSDGDLAAIAALNSAADKVPYYTGAGAAALADLTAKGRDIIAASNTLNLLGKLGPVLGGVAPIPSAAGVGLAEGDFNTVTVGGVYNITGNWLNGPNGNGSYAGFLMVLQRGGTQAWQIYRIATTTRDETYIRFTNDMGSNNWPFPWRRLAGELVGTVSQSGGVATGAILERGSNANGEYVRFADGTQICWTQGATFSYQSASFLSYSWTFPVSFSSGSPQSFSVTRSIASADYTGVLFSQIGQEGIIPGNASSSRSIFFGNTGASFASGNSVANCGIFAIGRWF